MLAYFVLDIIDSRLEHYLAIGVNVLKECFLLFARRYVVSKSMYYMICVFCDCVYSYRLV